jgi:transmembrane sensor
MNNFDLHCLLEKYRLGTCSQEEKALLESWYLSEMRRQDVKADHIDFDEIGSELWKSVQDDLAKADVPFQRPATFPWFRVAAIFLLLIGASFFIRYLSTNDKKSDAVMVLSKSNGKTSKIILSDGSIIWLKGNHSSLRYPSHFTENQRVVTLEGEALFEVARDTLHPFIVRCAQLTTRVLGTSFNIRTHPGSIEVALFTGKIELSDDKKQTIILKPHEKASYKTDVNQIVVEKAKPEEQASYTLGTQYDMHFDDSPISEVSKRIEEKFNVHFLVKNNTINDLLITADFTGQPLSQTLQMIARTLQVQCELKNDTVFLKERH